MEISKEIFVLSYFSHGYLYGLHFYRSLHRGFVLCGDFLTCYDGKPVHHIMLVGRGILLSELVANSHCLLYVSLDLLLLQKKTENELYVMVKRRELRIFCL